MSDEIKNAGTKGYIFAGVISFIILFVLLLIYIYQYNFKFLPVVG
ncbi:MAG: hypothetical protein AB8G22_04745 [Saprospiraceae bacterium]